MDQVKIYGFAQKREILSDEAQQLKRSFDNKYGIQVFVFPDVIRPATTPDIPDVVYPTWSYTTDWEESLFTGLDDNGLILSITNTGFVTITIDGVLSPLSDWNITSSSVEYNHTPGILNFGVVLEVTEFAPTAG